MVLNGALEMVSKGRGQREGIRDGSNDDFKEQISAERMRYLRGRHGWCWSRSGYGRSRGDFSRWSSE